MKAITHSCEEGQHGTYLYLGRVVCPEMTLTNSPSARHPLSTERP